MKNEVMSRKIINKDRLVVIICCALIAISLCRIVYSFIFLRTGHHSDEAWSYGFANSLYDPFIYLDINDDIYLSDATEKNINEWVPGKVFRDYLVVNTGEKFRFDSVINNKKGDISPPLYEIFIHLISSFFPNVFSWWFAFVINLACFFLIAILIIKIGDLLTNKCVGFISAAFYALSVGCYGNILFLRMYALLTAETLLFVYIFIKTIKDEYKVTWSRFIYIGLCVLTGSFTHFYFLLYAFLLMLFWSVGLLLNKRFFTVLKFGGLVLFWVVIFFLLYPSSIYRLMNAGTMYGNQKTFSYGRCLSDLLTYFLNYVLGIKWVVNRLFLVEVLPIVALIVMFAFMLLFLFRDSDKTRMLVSSIRKKCVLICENIVGFIRGKESTVHYIIFVMFLSIVCYLSVIAKISDITNMQYSAVRYVFNVMPIFVLIVVSLIKMQITIRKTKRSQGVIVFWLILGLSSVICQNLLYSGGFLYQDENNDINLHDYLVDSNVVILSDASWRMEWYATEVMDSIQVLYIDPMKCDSANEELSSISNCEKTVFIFERPSFINDYLNEMADINCVYLGDQEDLSEKAFIDKLIVINPMLSNMQYRDSINSFCGMLDIYVIDECE